MAKFIEVQRQGSVKMLNIDQITDFMPYGNNGKNQVIINGSKDWSITIDEDYRSFVTRLGELSEISFMEDE